MLHVVNRSGCMVWSCQFIEIHFSNSLIIQQLKTKKITTVKEVWIPGRNWHRF